MVIGKEVNSQYNALYTHTEIEGTDQLMFTLDYLGVQCSITFPKSVPFVLAKYTLHAVVYTTLQNLAQLEYLPTDELPVIQKLMQSFWRLGDEHFTINRLDASPAKDVIQEYSKQLYDLPCVMTCDIADVAQTVYPSNAEGNNVYVSVHSLVAKQANNEALIESLEEFHALDGGCNVPTIH